MSVASYGSTDVAVPSTPAPAPASVVRGGAVPLGSPSTTTEAPSAPPSNPRRPAALWSAMRSTIQAATHLRIGGSGDASSQQPQHSKRLQRVETEDDPYLRQDEDGISSLPLRDAHDDDLYDAYHRRAEQERVKEVMMRRKNTAQQQGHASTPMSPASAAGSANGARRSQLTAPTLIGGGASGLRAPSSANATGRSELGMLRSVSMANASSSSATRPGSWYGSQNPAPRQIDGWRGITHLLDDSVSAQLMQRRETSAATAGNEEQNAAEMDRQNAFSWHHPGQIIRGRTTARNLTSRLFGPLLSPSKSSSSPRQEEQQDVFIAGPSTSSFGTNPMLVSEEPEDMIDISTVHAIPEREDPLAYDPEAKRLLEEVDPEEELLQREDQKRKILAQEHERSLLFQIRAWSHRTLYDLLPAQARLNHLQKGILKCVIAYFVASLCTYSPWLSSHLALLLPNHDPDKKVPISNLHMIATVAVYFHPAKTLGAMLEADVYAIVGFVYSVALSLACMALAVFLHDRDQPLLSNVIIVFFFLGAAMGLVAWAKVKLGSPSFNTACSMIGIIIFTVTVQEGAAHVGRFSTDKVFQVTITVVAGVIISNLVCFAVWPQSATSALQADVKRNLTGFSTLLKVLTKTFLLDDPAEFHVDSDRIKRAISDHHASFTSLKKNLREAKLERVLDARIQGEQQDRYSKVVDSMNRLAQHLTGLRSSCGLQQKILSKQPNKSEHQGRDGEEDQEEETWEPREDAFSDFVESIGPHMRSLVFTCSRTLRNLRSTFLTAGDVALPDSTRDSLHQDTSFMSSASAHQSHFVPGSSFELLLDDLRLALERFQHEQTISIKRIYESTIYDEKRPLEELQQLVAAAGSEDIMPEEQVFLVFFFVFNLEEFAKELQYLVSALETVRQEEEVIARRWTLSWRDWLVTQSNLFSWSLFRSESPMDRKARRHAALQDRMAKQGAGFPEYRPHQVNTGQTPVADTFKMRASRLIWSTGRFMRRPDVKFAIKTGVGCALLAAPAFIHSTRPIFKDYHGQWALVSFFVVMSPTVGQSNQMGLTRAFATVIGAAAAYAAYVLFPDDNITLPIFGAIFSIPCFWAIVGRPQRASAARFILLTFNLTALYSYNLRKVGVEVEQIALKRMASVLVGVAWATLLTHTIWPMEARRQLAEGMADLLFKLSWLYQRLVLSYSGEPPDGSNSVKGSFLSGNGHDGDEESRPLLARDDGLRARDEFQPLELQLQVAIIQLEGLLVQTKHEPRLKGPFPIGKYKEMINCCQLILDKLHSMRCVTGRDAWHRLVRRDFVIPVNAYRREMVGNVLLFFYILASAFHLKSPLPPYMPPASQCRVVLLEQIRALPVVKRRQVRGGTEYLLFYSYALAMKEVIQELERLARIAQTNFGVLGGSIEQFERQFQAAPASVAHTPAAGLTPRASIIRT